MGVHVQRCTVLELDPALELHGISVPQRSQRRSEAHAVPCAATRQLERIVSMGMLESGNRYTSDKWRTRHTRARCMFGS